MPSNCPALFQDLISKMLVYNEDERISAKEVLEILGGELEQETLSHSVVDERSPNWAYRFVDMP